MPPDINVIGCVDALCRYYRRELNIRGVELQNELIVIRDNLPADVRHIRNYLEPIFRRVINSGELPENIFNVALNINTLGWIEGLNDRINNTNFL